MTPPVMPWSYSATNTSDLPLNRQLLIQVRDRIAADVDGFNMGNWVMVARNEPDEPTPDNDFCGTTCCIAGWALTMHYGTPYFSGRYINTLSTTEAGSNVLGLPRRVGMNLFHIDQWPDWATEYCVQRDEDGYVVDQDSAREAEVAVELINQLLEFDEDFLDRAYEPTSYDEVMARRASLPPITA